MSDKIPKADDEYHFLAYELVLCVFQYIETDTPFHHLIATPTTPRLFTDELFQRVRGYLNVLVLPLMASMHFTKVLGEDINITTESYNSAVKVAVDVYKDEEFSENKLLIMCTSIAIWGFLARRRGLPDSDVEAVKIIKKITTDVLRNRSFQNLTW